MPQQQPPINCPICQSPIRNIPAGVSRRTGKPYGEFWSCVNRDCNFTWRPEREKKTEPSWEVILNELTKITKRLDSIDTTIEKMRQFFIEKE